MKIEDTKVYKVEKVNAVTMDTYDYGVLSGEDVKAIIKGYKYNGFFFDRKNSNSFYTVEEITK